MTKPNSGYIFNLHRHYKGGFELVVTAFMAPSGVVGPQVQVPISFVPNLRSHLLLIMRKLQINGNISEYEFGDDYIATNSRLPLVLIMRKLQINDYVAIVGGHLTWFVNN